MQVLQFGRQIVPDHLHGFERRLVKIRWLSIHHLYDHDAQRPDVHLHRENVPVDAGRPGDVKSNRVAAVRRCTVTSGP